MKNILSFFTLVLLLLGTSGCSGKPPPPVMTEAKPLPSWFTQPKANDEAFLYAVASGENSEEAVKKALVALVSKLSVRVSASFEKQTEVFKSAGAALAQTQMQSRLSTQVSEIQISYYEILHSEKLDYKNYVVMVQVDRPRWAQVLKTDLKIKKEHLDKTLHSIATMDLLKQLIALEESFNEAQKMGTALLLLGVLDPSFDSAKNMQFIHEIYQKYLDVKSRIKFYVEPLNKESASFSIKIKNALAQEYALSNTPHNAITVRCDVKLRKEATEFGFNLAVMDVRIDLISDTQKIGGSTLLVKDRYKEDLEATLQRGALSFDKEIQIRGIVDILGMKL